MPAKMFGVETKDDFYAKYIAQGCWTRCLQCQRSAGIGFTSSSDNIKSHFVGKDDVVEATAENLSCDMHGCGKCGSVFPKEHWSAQMRKDHKRYKTDLVCNSCKQQGFSLGKYEVHTCQECELTLGHGRFDKDVLYDAKRQKGSKKICKDTLVQWI